MAVNRTGQAVFDKAIYLIDAQNESSGATMNSDTREYQVRAVGILNTLLDDVYPASSGFRASENGELPALPDLADLSEEIELDPRLLRDVLPNGLAAELLSQENPSLANYFRQKYERSLSQAMANAPARVEAIDNPYGEIEFGQFGRWL